MALGSILQTACMKRDLLKLSQDTTITIKEGMFMEGMVMVMDMDTTARERQMLYMILQRRLNQTTSPTGTEKVASMQALLADNF